MSRVGDWVMTMPFSLNAVESDWFESQDFQTDSISIVPMVTEFATSGVDPSGSRHLTTHPSFRKVLASGKGFTSLSFPALDFSSVNIGSGSGISCTRAIIFRIHDFELNTTSITDMKMWSPDMTDFLCPETSAFVFQPSGQWEQNFSFGLDSLLDKNKKVPTSLPESQNIFRQDGATHIYQTGDDHVSQYIYLALVASGTTPLGEYVGNPSGYNLRFSYDFHNITTLRD